LLNQLAWCWPSCGAPSQGNDANRRANKEQLGEQSVGGSLPGQVDASGNVPATPTIDEREKGLDAWPWREKALKWQIKTKNNAWKKIVATNHP
jgi:hypothetical protein